ncbi:MAG: TatD family hydrolase [Rhodoferax sp.]
MVRWIDTHCHLDAPEFASDRAAVRAQARAVGVTHCVLPAVEVANFDAVRALAHAEGDSYCLGIHPLYVPQAGSDALEQLQEQLRAHRDDPRLVAVGEIGLDFFVPALQRPDMRARQEQFCREQLRLARAFDLPVVLHVRRSADRLLKHLREVGQGGYRWRGIAHAFNGSAEQAPAFIDLGLALGFGGAVTFERALQLRRLVCSLPLQALVLETDAPDIAPQWRYVAAQQRAAGQAQGRNDPAQLPRIAEVVAQLRGLALPALAQATTDNAVRALPKLEALLV